MLKKAYFVKFCLQNIEVVFGLLQLLIQFAPYLVALLIQCLQGALLTREFLENSGREAKKLTHDDKKSLF